MPKLRFVVTMTIDVDPSKYDKYYNGAKTIHECAAAEQQSLDNGDTDILDYMELLTHASTKVEGIED
jgi:hypothetical protein